MESFGSFLFFKEICGKFLKPTHLWKWIIKDVSRYVLTLGVECTFILPWSSKPFISKKTILEFRYTIIYFICKSSIPIYFIMRLPLILFYLYAASVDLCRKGGLWGEAVCYSGGLFEAACVSRSATHGGRHSLRKYFVDFDGLWLVILLNMIWLHSRFVLCILYLYMICEMHNFVSKWKIQIVLFLWD